MTFKILTGILGLDNPGRTVLIVEDHVGVLERLTKLCRELNHSVIAMLGVETIENGIAWGPGTEAPQSVDLSKVEVAFLDHYFLSRNYNGASFTRELRLHSQAHILGMSSDANANAAMAREGADLTMRKVELIRLLPM